MDKTNPYEVLGLTPEATAGEVKQAYRKAASQYHPDREGGDEEMFKLSSAAHDTLSDPEKRRRYDQTGDWAGLTERVLTVEEEASKLFSQMVAELSSEEGNLLQVLRDQARAARDQIAKDVKKLKREGVLLERRLRLITFRGNGLNPLAAGLKMRQAAQAPAQAKAERTLEMVELIQKWLKDYNSDEQDDRPLKQREPEADDFLQALSMAFATSPGSRRR